MTDQAGILLDELNRVDIPPDADAKQRAQLVADAKQRARQRVQAEEKAEAERAQEAAAEAKREAWRRFDDADTARLAAIERLTAAIQNFGVAFSAAVAAAIAGKAAFPADPSMLPAEYTALGHPVLYALVTATGEALPIKNAKQFPPLAEIARAQSDLILKFRTAADGFNPA